MWLIVFLFFNILNCNKKIYNYLLNFTLKNIYLHHDYYYLDLFFTIKSIHSDLQYLGFKCASMSLIREKDSRLAYLLFNEKTKTINYELLLFKYKKSLKNRSQLIKSAKENCTPKYLKILEKIDYYFYLNFLMKNYNLLDNKSKFITFLKKFRDFSLNEYIYSSLKLKKINKFIINKKLDNSVELNYLKRFKNFISNSFKNNKSKKLESIYQLLNIFHINLEYKYLDNDKISFIKNYKEISNEKSIFNEIFNNILSVGYGNNNNINKEEEKYFEYFNDNFKNNFFKIFNIEYEIIEFNKREKIFNKTEYFFSKINKLEKKELIMLEKLLLKVYKFYSKSFHYLLILRLFYLKKHKNIVNMFNKNVNFNNDYFKIYESFFYSVDTKYIDNLKSLKLLKLVSTNLKNEYLIKLSNIIIDKNWKRIVFIIKKDIYLKKKKFDLNYYYYNRKFNYEIKKNLKEILLTTKQIFINKFNEKNYIYFKNLKYFIDILQFLDIVKLKGYSNDIIDIEILNLYLYYHEFPIYNYLIKQSLYYYNKNNKKYAIHYLNICSLSGSQICNKKLYEILKKDKNLKKEKKFKKIKNQNILQIKKTNNLYWYNILAYKDFNKYLITKNKIYLNKSLRKFKNQYSLLKSNESIINIMKFYLEEKKIFKKYDYFNNKLLENFSQKDINLVDIILFVYLKMKYYLIYFKSFII